jgi:hypothetical protein
MDGEGRRCQILLPGWLQLALTDTGAGDRRATRSNCDDTFEETRFRSLSHATAVHTRTSGLLCHRVGGAEDRQPTTHLCGLGDLRRTRPAHQSRSRQAAPHHSVRAHQSFHRRSSVKCPFCSGANDARAQAARDAIASTPTAGRAAAERTSHTADVVRRDTAGRRGPRRCSTRGNRDGRGRRLGGVRPSPRCAPARRATRRGR